MEPKKVGRVLGVGVRVASRMVQQRLAEGSAPPSQNVAEAPARQAAAASTATRSSRDARGPAGLRAATAKRGFKAFREAFMGPFTHAGGILWLEITGMFFALFALFFVQSVYRARGSWRTGPDHVHLMLYVALMVVFAWFSVSSFLRAQRKSKRGRSGLQSGG